MSDEEHDLRLSPDVDQERLYATTDAVVWADEFTKVAPEVDRGLMIGWFANAMEVARLEGSTWDGPRSLPDADFVCFPRDTFWQWLGGVALPADDTDCAPIASALIDWVDTHDLSGVVLRMAADG